MRIGWYLVRGFAPDRLVDFREASRFQSDGGGDAISPSGSPIRGPDLVPRIGVFSYKPLHEGTHIIPKLRR